MYSGPWGDPSPLTHPTPRRWRTWPGKELCRDSLSEPLGHRGRVFSPLLSGTHTTPAWDESSRGAVPPGAAAKHAFITHQARLMAIKAWTVATCHLQTRGSSSG